MNKKLKGFTLMELIIVIAIIAVLSAIFIPSWMNWITMSKVRKQNNNARTIFNAAQTVVQDYKFRERKLNDSDKSIGNGDFYFYWNKNSGVATGDATNVGDADFMTNFTNQLNKMYGDAPETAYRIYVHNYMVQSVVASSGNTNRNKGSYPTKQDGRNNVDVQNFDMESIVLNPTT